MWNGVGDCSVFYDKRDRKKVRKLYNKKEYICEIYEKEVYEVLDWSILNLENKDTLTLI